jgi:hypothetical protein
MRCEGSWYSVLRLAYAYARGSCDDKVVKRFNRAIDGGADSIRALSAAGLRREAAHLESLCQTRPTRYTRGGDVEIDLGADDCRYQKRKRST